MAQKRVHYGCSQFAVKKFDTVVTDDVLPLSASGVNPSDIWEVPRGVQEVSITTTFDTENVFQLGQLATYQIVENIPNIEVSSTRVLDGTHPLYLISSDEAAADLLGRNKNYRVV